jgi:P-type Ca2+ transporter type 2C
LNSENSSLKGLDHAEAALRLSRDGHNELPGQGPRGILPIILEVLSEPMFLLLIAAAGIYMVLGDLQESLVLCASLVVVVLITVLQERRTEQALAKLRDLSSPRALVIRGGVEHRIPGREVVVGDILLLREGDRVPADAVLRGATAISVDESILTGESLPVEKTWIPIGAGTQASRVYSGSLVVHGFGVSEVTATGAHSELGRIGQALKDLTPEVTSMFREVRRIVRWVATGGVLLCMVVAALYALSRHDWLGGVLAGITLAMGVLPEEFPVVLTVFLAMGAWRISRANVLTRRMPAVETIGAVTVLAVDKTGTLTENRMRLALIQTMDRTFDLRRTGADLDAAADAILGTALAASERDAFDPMEHAIQQGAALHAPARTSDLAGMSLAREYDLTPELLAVTHVWRRPGVATLEVHVKGAPETVIDMCAIQPASRERLLAQVAAHAANGMRVLGIARGEHADDGLPESPRSFGLQLLGFVCLSDPLRADVPAVLAECAQAGIRVVMITGDHPGTALAIAAQAGFDTGGGALTGAELAALDDVQLRERVRRVNVYARARPEHKLRLVQAFKANGEVIAMTGDGVNDAPALKAAHVGVAMGERGTDVAREAASLVLVKDDFNSLVMAVRLVRRVYDNIGHAMAYIVSVHIPVAGLGLIPVLLDWPLLFFPMHVLFLEFVVDPACALVFEADPENPGIMRKPPRRPDAPLFSAPVIRRSILLGMIPLLAGTITYGMALRTVAVDEARALAFVAILAGNLALIFVSRSRSATLIGILRRPNRIFWWIAALATLALSITIYVPAVARVFHFEQAPVATVLAVFTLTAAAVLLSGLALRSRPHHQGSSVP